MLVKNPPSPTKKFAFATLPKFALLLYKCPTFAFPVTLNALSVPKLVILGCELVVIVPVKKFAVATLPKSALPDVILPLTLKFDSVPTADIFGCDAVINVPDKKLALAKLPNSALPDVRLPVNDKLVPIAASILGEFNCGLFARTT